MKRIYLLRHAKSSWKNATLADHDRPLSGRGRRAASAMCGHLQARGIEPALVLCSSSRRTVETLARIAPSLAGAQTSVEPALYGASAQTLLERLRRLPADLDSVLLIAHNPGLHGLALHLVEPTPAPDTLAAKFPTGALATFDVSAEDWRALGPATAKLTAFVRPRDLE